MAAACNEACGHCGKCTERWEGHPQDREEVEHCLVCHQTIERVSIAVWISKYITGAVCSEICHEDWHARGQHKAS